MIPLANLHGRLVDSLSEPERIAFELAEARGYAFRDRMTSRSDIHGTRVYEYVVAKSECGCG